MTYHPMECGRPRLGARQELEVDYAFMGKPMKCVDERKEEKKSLCSSAVGVLLIDRCGPRDVGSDLPPFPTKRKTSSGARTPLLFLFSLVFTTDQ